MSAVDWDPSRYAHFADERSRPFLELTARVGAPDPRTVLDVGCGDGRLTALLAQRWPTADVRGVDSSPDMVAAAARPGITQGDAAAVEVSGVDVVVSNAALQWVPGHTEVLARWAEQLAPGAWLAVQLPANFDAPSHVLMRELAESPAWQDRLGGVLRHGDAVAEPAVYLGLLAERGMAVDVWQSTYQHVLDGADPVLSWVRGTGLRPVLAALDAEDGARFSSEYAARLREAYPRRPWGTVFPFTRTFVVAHR